MTSLIRNPTPQGTLVFKRPFGQGGDVFLLYNNKEYTGRTAIEIVRAIQLDSPEYSGQNDSVKDFLVWSLDKLTDKIPPREMGISIDLPDEVVAFNYLCLLDSYDGGRLVE